MSARSARRMVEVLFRLGGLAVAGVILFTTVPVFLWPPLARAWTTMHFPQTEGAVTASEPTKTEGSRTYTWKLEYTYAVNGKNYTGTRYAFSEPDWYYPEDIERLTAAFPVGAKVPVAYNPDDPSDAALRPGQAGRLFESAALALLVCGIGCFFGWAALIAPWSDASTPPPPRLFDPDNPRHVERTHDGVRVRLPSAPVIHPLLAVVMVGVVIVLIARNRPTPPEPYPGWAGFLIAVAAPLMLVAMFALTRRQWITLDSWHKTFVYHPGPPWRELQLAFRDVGEVGVTTREQQMKGGIITYYQVRLYSRVRGKPREVVMCEYLNSEDAEALVLWLREQLAEGLRQPALT